MEDEPTAADEVAAVEEDAPMAKEVNVEVFMDGLSRIDRVLDDSGYAFTALDVVVRYPMARFAHLVCNQSYRPRSFVLSRTSSSRASSPSRTTSTSSS